MLAVLCACKYEGGVCLCRWVGCLSCTCVFGGQLETREGNVAHIVINVLNF